MARRARIAVSVFFGLLTVALCVLWVRSYWRVDNIWWQITPHRTLFVRVTPGQLTWWSATESLAYPTWEWKKYTYPAADYAGDFEGTITRPYLGGNLTTGLPSVLPLWLPAAICAGVALIFSKGLLFRFSLRTLLFATTLVAVLLGLIVWAVR